MSHHKSFTVSLWSRLLFPLGLAALVLLAQPAVAGSAASAASRPTSSAHTTAAQSATPSDSMTIKPATLAWLKTHPNQPQTRAIPTRSATPSTLTCQQSEDCTCPSSFTRSQYYECEWYYGFWPFSGGVLSISYWVDPNLPSSMQTWAIDGANLWVNSAANVYFYRSGTQSSADVEIDAAYNSTSCQGRWGYTTPNGPPISHVQVHLEVGNSNCDPSGRAWVTTAAHELGHSIGLEHNEWYDSTNGTYMLMNSCGSCSITPYGPQSMDITLVNAMYPPTESSPALFSNCNGWGNYLDERAYNQSGQFDSNDTIPASMAYMNTWYATARSGSTCDSAKWQVGNPSHQCAILYLWVPSGFASATSMTVTIVSSLAGHGTWYNYVNVDENVYTGYYDLGEYPYATNVEVADNAATPIGSQIGVGGLLLNWC